MAPWINWAVMRRALQLAAESFTLQQLGHGVYNALIATEVMNG